MKCDSIKFVYRGTNLAGRWLADLLEEMSIEYTVGGSIADNIDSTHVSADLGALLRTLDKRVITPKNTSTIPTAVPPVRVWRRDIVQWLRAMNIPFDVPITLQFVNKPSIDADAARNPLGLDWEAPLSWPSKQEHEGL